ncbi:hypothetical protein U9M48_007258 [Paspalum notatum var. saurae]|uniref:Ricin B lectin domain-containing protein n=1 Tax=Paspalum notatum var. saurae TaxID=547442 RepID=A0AAQ3PZQ0_PASNO
MLATANPHDERQIWYRVMVYADAFPAFALVNKATGVALQQSPCRRGPVLVEQGHLDDESFLWVEGKEDLGDGSRRVHAINDTDCVFDAERGSDYGGARLILFHWTGDKNQQWRIAPHSATAAPQPAAELPLQLPAPEHARAVRVLCQSDPGLCITVRDGAAVLARVGKDDRQRWIQSYRNAGYVTDDKGHRAFALVNWVTGKALRSRGVGDEPVGLVGHKPDSVEVALLWTQSEDLGKGFHGLRTVSDVDLVLDAAGGVPECAGAHDGTPIIVFPWNGGLNQKWKMVPFY